MADEQLDNMFSDNDSDLGNIDFDNIDLDNLDLDNLDLDNLDLDNMDLNNIDLDNIDLDNMDLDSANDSEGIVDLDALLDAQLAEALAQEQLTDDNEIFQNLDFAETEDSEAFLDAQLAEALEKDREAEESIELQDGIEDFVKDRAVYSDDEILERPPKPGRFDKINERINGISSKFLMAMLWALVVLSALMLGLGAVMIVRTSRLNSELANRGTIIHQGSSTANSAGFIFVESAIGLTDGEVTLTKINLSRISSVFYFDGYIDMTRHDAQLFDDWGRVYYLDRSYYDGLDLTDSSSAAVMWFDPLPQDVGSFTLEIIDLETKTGTLHKFSIGQEMVLERAKYTKEPIIVETGGGTAAMELSNAIFSSTGTQITYALKQLDPNEQILPGQNGQEYLSLLEKGRLVSRTPQTFGQYTFSDGTIIGRIDFMPVQSLSNKVQVQFDNMYKMLAVNREVNLADIFYTNTDPTKTLEVGPYRIVLERAGIQVDQYVLVMHAEDTREESFSGRTRSFLDVTMIARKGDKSIELMPSIIRDSEEGTDIVFDGKSEAAFLFGIPIDQISFRIDSAYIKLPSSSLEIDLDQAEQRLPLNPDNAISSVKLAFERRLGYKSGKFEYEDLDRFSESILQNNALMSVYKPTGESDASVAVHVTAWHLDGDRLYAVIRETWRGNEYFHRVHKIVADYGDRGWIITEDEIIG